MGQPSIRRGYYTVYSGGQTGGTETSKYPEEKKTKVIPWVAASERGAAQTGNVEAYSGVVGLRDGIKTRKWNGLERPVAEGDNPVHESLFWAYQTPE